MKTLALLLLTATTVTTVSAEQWCVSRSGRLRIRPDACRTFDVNGVPYERTLPQTTSARTLAVVDKDGALVGHVSNAGAVPVGQELSVLRQGPDGRTLALTVNADGLEFPGFEVLYFVAPDCTGPPLIPAYTRQERNGLVVLPAIQAHVAHVPVGEPAEADTAAYLVPLNGSDCPELGGTFPFGDDRCCLPFPSTAAFHQTVPYRLADDGLEPPFRLSMEP